MRPWRRPGAVMVLVAGLLATGCAAGNAYRQGQQEASRGNWDLAVARLTKALEKAPDNIQYRMALENARVQASRFHQGEARKHVAAEDLDRAAEELLIATRFDPSNESAAGDLVVVGDKIRKRDEAREERERLESVKERAESVRVKMPVLSPRSRVPITLHFTETTLDKIFETLSKVSGVNILFDEAFRGDKRVSYNVTGVTFEEALDQLTFVNRLFYKVVDQNTIIVVPEQPAKRRSYDDLLVRTFYLENAEAKDMLTLVKNITGITKSASNEPINAITLLGTADQLALAERVIDANDKARGEVMVQVEILEVNRRRLKQYGIELANYTAGVTFSPSGASGELAGGLTNLRAHLLASLNLADFVVSIPSGLLTRFLQTDSNVRLLAAPRLRAAEGKKTTLRIGTEVPIPVTTFTATQAGTSTFAPATSFQYRNVGVNLEMTPKVSATGDITLELNAEFSLLGENQNVGTGDNPINVPTFNTRNVNGTLRMREGQTMLVGGLVQGRDTDTLTGVLGLQSIPVLNKVFTSREKIKEESEIVISLTPHLVRAPKLLEVDFTSLRAGTQERVSVPSARPPLFGEDVPASPAPPAAPVPPAADAPLPPSAAPETIPEGTPEAVAPDAGEDAGGTPPAADDPPRRITALLSPPVAVVARGASTPLSVVVLGAAGLLGVEVVLTYDSGLLEAQNDAAPGPLLTLDGQPVSAERNLEPGSVRLRFTRGTPTSGSGALAIVNLKALDDRGTAVVAIQSLNIITETGVVTVPLPSPARLTMQP
jgi:general secretion pathway protein D